MAVRELLVNAVQHRSYVDATRPIYVAVYDDRIEITSPGGLPYSLSIDMMRQGRSAHRNPVISMIFRAAGLCEGWGNGISLVMDECRKYGLPEPKIENSGMDVRVTLYRKEFGGNLGGDGGNLGGDGGNLGGNHSESNNQRRLILSMLLENPGMTVRDLSTSTSIPPRTVERLISDLKKEGIIIRTGSTRRGQWIVKKI